MSEEEISDLKDQNIVGADEEDAQSADSGVTGEKIPVENDDLLSETAEAESNVVSELQTDVKVSSRKYHAPLYIALIILLAAILFFLGKLCFFNTNIDGTWGMTIKGEGNNPDQTFNLSFDDSVARLQSAGTAFIGRLTIKDENGNYLKDEAGRSVLSISMNIQGNPYIFKFNYEFTGNAFTGRTLRLTDLSGMFLAPDSKSADKETLEKHKKANEYVERDNTVYYIWSFTPSVEDMGVKKDKNFKPDKKLVGSWLYKSDDNAYPHTMTFTEDGLFEQHYYEYETYGTYSVKDGVCTIKYIELGNDEKKFEINYKVEGDELTLTQEYEGTVLAEEKLKKTDDKYSFKSEIR